MAAGCPLIHQQGRLEPALKDYLTSLATQACILRELETLPSAHAFLWPHLLRKTAVFFTRNCYQSRGPKKKKKPKQNQITCSGSWSLFPVSACQPKCCLIQKHREEAPANEFKNWELCLWSAHKVRTCSIVLGDIWFPRDPSQPNATEFYYLGCTIYRKIRNHQSWSRPSAFSCDEASQAAGPAHGFHEHLSGDMWPISQHGCFGCCLLRNVYARHNGERLHHMGSGCKLIGCRQLPAKEALSNTGRR